MTKHSLLCLLLNTQSASGALPGQKIVKNLCDTRGKNLPLTPTSAVHPSGYICSAPAAPFQKRWCFPKEMMLSRDYCWKCKRTCLSKHCTLNNHWSLSSLFSENRKQIIFSFIFYSFFFFFKWTKRPGYFSGFLVHQNLHMADEDRLVEKGGIVIQSQSQSVF